MLAVPKTPKEVKGVTVKMTEKERDSLKKVAAELGVTPHRMLQKAMREMIGMTPELLKDDLEQFNLAVVELNSIGRNLNQITRKLHTPHANITIDSVLLEKLNQKLEKLIGAVVRISNRQTDRWKLAKAQMTAKPNSEEPAA